MDKKLHLVGSIPFDTAEDVFEQFGAPLGEHLHTMPDGEVGLRSHWISRVHYQVLALHPDIEVVRQPKLDSDAERLNPRNASDSWLFRVSAEAGPIQFGDPGWRGRFEALGEGVRGIGRQSAPPEGLADMAQDLGFRGAHARPRRARAAHWAWKPRPSGAGRSR